MARDALAEIADLERKPKQTCRAMEALDEVSKELRPGVVTAMSGESGLSTTAIAKWFNKEGINISDQSILRHRKGNCVCK